MTSRQSGYLSRDKRVDFEREDGWGVVETEGAASKPDSAQAAPMLNKGGNHDSSTLASDPVNAADLF